jgi:ribose transport system permease protein
VSAMSKIGLETPDAETGLLAGSQRPGWRSMLSPANIGAVYVWILVIVVFLIWSPDLFATHRTVTNIVNNQAITGLMALSLIVPLAAAVFDLSVAYTMGVSAIMVAKLIADGHGLALSIAVVMLMSVGIGIVNAIVVVRMKIDSFVATLATGALLQAVILMISDQPIASPTLLGSFSKIANWRIGGVTTPVFFVLILALVLWYVLGHTPVGRRLYATGYGVEAARLTGIPTARIQASALVVSATIAGFAGIVVTSRVTSGSPTVGPPYLLPGFAAAFVGATILARGRFNPWGTVIAVLLLGTGTEGLADVNAPVWAPSIFVGATLIAAVGLTGWQRRRVGR